ncbi:hypothetical protein [Clostridium neonatale]|uniref:hypothetical protein n=1 Tax=Clostridium neonatale TaxID=137838 RepID=UPI00291B968A|nr:hypothetical protein CNEO3_1190005 [Clostridium neonatale]CAI3564804.1 hypothetical protein CNEO3_1310002 [Clostridium neonatale]CAI3564805.1 hypothetical protein CNEO3_1580005 [Clostridium neonatale]CAI3575450.1 hypothetical protein CNEO3_1450005 [Clostridium neonatale]CAI3585962.1 hypothetical protein CNEO3_1540005 [Clostridium neonatale]
MNEDRSRKKCFIITPIGNENTETRRHIDGVINECIRPILEEKYQYQVNAAHEFTTPGSINNQVIEAIYTSDLVIANLTELNPNVMYELALRHAFRKPVIIIMENGNDKLPFDITTERTIFYDNDFQGAINLKMSLNDMVKSIQEIKDVELDNPVYNALERLNLKENLLKTIGQGNDTDVDAISYMVERLDQIEQKISTEIILEDGRRGIRKNETEIVLFLNEDIKKDEEIQKAQGVLERRLHDCQYYKNVVSYGIHGRWFRIVTKLVGNDKESFIKYLEDTPNWYINKATILMA